MQASYPYPLPHAVIHIMIQILTGPSTRPAFRKRKEKKNYAGSENHSPHEVKEKKAIFVPSTVKLLYRRQKRSSRRGPEQSTRRRK
jgi:hypothetical protein